VKGKIMTPKSSVKWVDRLGVCGWSLQANDPATLITRVKETGLTRLQTALDPIRRDPEGWSKFQELCRTEGITLVSGMIESAGEDYSTMESIRRTGGLVPDETWEENWANAQITAPLAEKLGLRLVTFHAGFLPHDPKDPEMGKLLHRIRLMADLFASHRIDLAMETGQETASSLSDFLELLGRPTVGVNFDPANMILYDKGNPIDALRTLAPWLKQCHIKDAKRTDVPGSWGEEVTTGTGEVDWREFFSVLGAVHYDGFCNIEREAGTQRVADIRAGHAYVKSILAV
jgi:L-ribulose-5-phosphate 3-epimerase